MSETIAVPTPALDKMMAVTKESQAIGDFIDWLECKLIEGRVEDRYVPDGTSTEELLAAYFGIDLRAVERERRAILEAVRASHHTKI